LLKLLPVLALVSEIRMKNRLARTLLETYVGSHAGELILAGCPYQKSRPGWRRWSNGLPFAGMLDLLKLLGGFVVGLFRLPAAREAELAFLRQQLLVLRRSAPARLRLRIADLGRESEHPRADLKVQVLARPSIDLFRSESLQRFFRLANHGLQISKGERANRCGRGEHAGFRSFQPPHCMVPSRFGLKVERCHVVEEAGGDEIVGIAARIHAIRDRASKEAADSPYGLQEGWHAQVIKRHCHRLPHP